MKPILLLTLGLIFSVSSYANNCSGARSVPTNGSVSMFFDSSCDFSPASQKLCTGCTGDIWFLWSDSSSNATNKQVRFRLEANNPVVVNMYLLYSESSDAGDPCAWDVNNEGYSQLQVLCNFSLGGSGAPFSFNNRGLDGSATYFILVEKVSGTGNRITLEPAIFANCPQPANDRCSSPQPLAVGSGIDPSVLTGSGSSNWMNAFSTTNKCATKQRMTSNITPSSTEDHYSRTTLSPIFDGNLGDNINIFGTANKCDQFIESTVFYSFQAPVTANDYYLHFGTTSQCQQDPNFMVAMLFSSLDCSDARSSNRMDCDKYSIFGNMPVADHTMGPYSFNAGQTYYIVMDGTRGNQCDFNILVARDPIDPILPVQLNYFTGDNQGASTLLNWQTELEETFHYFEVEAGPNHMEMDVIGRVQGAGINGLGTTYDFVDHNPQVGLTSYRLRMVDIDGQFVHSPVVEIWRDAPDFSLESIFPQPAREELYLRLNLPQQDDIHISLTDLAGRSHLQDVVRGEAGKIDISLPIQSLPAGLYLVHLRYKDRMIVKKVVIR